MFSSKHVAEGTQLDVLAIFSHPDDAELTMAGTLLKLKSLGYRTGVLDMTRGEMGTRGTAEIRAKESLDAARVMGLDVRLNLELPDGHVSVNDGARSAMVQVLRAHRPRVVFTSHWDDPHPDHAATCRIVREAARLMTYWVASKVDEDPDRMLPREASMVKLFVTEAARRAALEGMQMMGGYGYSSEYDMERLVRSTLVSTIYGGTSEIQRNIIAKTLGL